MTRTERNAVANFVGQAWSAGLALFLVPLYIRFLGIEAYGLIGVYAMLQASFQVLDLGLTQTMNREMARYSVFPERAAEQRDFVRTVETAYWLVGGLLGVGVAVAAPLVARHWVNPGSLRPDTVRDAVVLMGLVTALQWPLSLYEGGLLGLQRQVALSALKVGVATLAGGGAVVVLWRVSPTIHAYFAWQAAVVAVNVLVVAVLLWRSLPASDRRPRSQRRLLLANWRFALGMSGIAASAVVLMQLDKFLLSKLLPLEAFGYYTLAGVVASVVPTLLVGPVFNAAFPRLASMVAAGDERGVVMMYHGLAQVIAAVAVTVSGVLALFSSEILLAWTRDARAAATAGPILRVLVVGMALNALMTPSYALQIAHGWTGIGLRISVGLAIVFVPMVVLLTSRVGAIGGATAWAVLNALYLAVGLWLTHRRLLRRELRPWFLRDVLPPTATSLLAVTAVRLLVPAPETLAGTIAAVAASLAAGATAAALTTPVTREWLSRTLRGRPLTTP